jgi:branched-chain amino acid transport system permease protein
LRRGKPGPRDLNPWSGSLDLPALAECLISPSCIVTQTTSGLIIGLLLFMVAAGVSLIFGVLKVVNFAHGSFYMLGAYFAYTAYQVTDSYTAAVLAGGIGVAIFGLLFERLLIARVYGSPVLMQILVCYGVILILDDVVKLVWGADFLSFGMPETFRALPFLFAGGVIPVFYMFLIVVTLIIAALLGLLITKTRYGKIVRAAAVNPTMVSALGINTGVVYASVFVLGGLLAGLAGGLAAPVRSLTAGMGLSVVIESFIVTVIGGMGSVAGALVGSLLIGLVRSFGSIGFPLFTEGLMFLMMVIVLVLKPSGLFGKEGR